MKRAVAIFLSFVFLLCTVGFSISTHFCSANGTATASFEKKESPCGCNSSHQDNCCHNKTKHFKITDNYTPATSILFHSITPIDLFAFLLHTNLFSANSFSTEDIIPLEHAPPALPVSFSILFRSLLI